MGEREMSVTSEGEFVEREEITESEREERKERLNLLFQTFQEEYEIALGRATEETAGGERLDINILNQELRSCLEYCEREDYSDTEWAFLQVFYRLPRMADLSVEMQQPQGKTKANLIEASDWQIETSRMIEGLRVLDHPDRGEILRDFWAKLEHLYDKGEADPTLAKKLKTGILGLTPIIQLAQKIGLEAYYPFPEQDAREGIDLWIKIPNLPKGKGVFALQIKSRSLGSVNIYHQEVDDRTARADPEQKMLLTSAKKYSRIWGTPVIPVWIEVGGVEGLEIQIDIETGEVSEKRLEELGRGDLSGYLRGKLARKEAA